MTSSGINKQPTADCNFAIDGDQFCALIREQQVTLNFNSIPEVPYGK